MTGRNAIQRVRATRTLLGAFIATLLLIGGPYPVLAEEQTLSERVLHHRGIEAIVWAMPMLNFKGMRNSVMSLGVEFLIEVEGT